MEIHFAYAAFKKDFYLQKTLSYDLGDSMKLLLYFKLSAKQLLERRFIQLSCDMRILLAIEMSVPDCQISYVVVCSMLNLYHVPLGPL